MPGNLMKHEIFGFDAPRHPDRWVYHYTSLSSAVAIASSRTFRFNSLANMNDPREFKDLVLPVMSSGRPLTKTKVDLTQMLVNQRRLAVRLGAFTRDDAAGDDSSLVRTDSRGYARPMMWTHYADKHRGICFVLDRHALERVLHGKFGSDVLVGDVAYSSLTTPPAWTPVLEASEVHASGEAITAQRFFETNRRDLLFIKNQDWSVEREWRVAIDNHTSGVVDVPVGSGVVEGLVVGLDASDSNLADVQAVAGAFGIADHVARAYLHQVNVIDVIPVDTSRTPWRYYTGPELHGLGYL